MSIPAVTVLLINYNHGRYLRQCLAGILRQTFRNFEVVVTDDGSTDDSRDIIKQHAAKDARIRPNYFESNRGILAAFDDVCQRARGTYIFGHGSDDFIVDENFLAKAIKGFKTHPEAAAFFGMCGTVSAETNKLSGAIGSAPQEGYIAPMDFFRGFLRGQIFVPGSSSIWRADLLKEFGGFDCAYGAQTDFVINHCLPSIHGVVYTHAPVTCQRVYDKPVNYGSKGTLWEAAARYAKVEERLRSLAHTYDGMEDDWRTWRARWMIDAIEKSGVKLR